MSKCITITGAIAAFLIATAPFASAKEMSVQIRIGEIKATASPLSTIVTTVKYGQRLTVLEEHGSWVKVSTADNKTGWIHSSALTKEKLEFAASGKDAQTGASSGEMALAGKGFTKEVEAQYKAKHSNIDFKWIDKMEAMKVSPPEVMSFLKEGQITIPEGGK